MVERTGHDVRAATVHLDRVPVLLLPGERRRDIGRALALHALRMPGRAARVEHRAASRCGEVEGRIGSCGHLALEFVTDANDRAAGGRPAPWPRAPRR